MVLVAAVFALLSGGAGLAQGISKGVGSFPVTEAPKVAGVVPVAPPEPSAGGGMVGLLASDPLAIQAAMLAEGFQARLTTNSNGDPMITGRVSKTDYWVYFQDCTDGANCKAVQFHSGYMLNRPIDAAELNDFNSRYRFMRSFLNDEGYPRMQMDLLMRDEGMGPKLFATYVDLWRQLIGHWERQLGI